MTAPLSDGLPAGSSTNGELPLSVRPRVFTPEGQFLQPGDSAPGSRKRAAVRFVESHPELGVEFYFDNGSSSAKLMIESTSGGAGWLDFDADGWWDLYFPQGGNPFSKHEPQRPSSDQLYRNIAGRRFGCTAELARLHDQEFGHGVAIGDFDSDGFDDVYVCNVGPDILYQNLGDGTFRDITAEAGVDNRLWSSSAAWGDLDLDGNLDMYVCTYVDYDPRNPIACLSQDGNPGICHPEAIDAVPDVCYFSQGDGRFRNESQDRGLTAPDGKSLGLVIADLNRDGLPDVYVANDTTANHLFVNQGGGRFKEQGVALGCALSGLGHFQASMGVAFGDFDGNGYPDLYCTHFTEDSNTLYANLGPSGFEDVTRSVGLHHPTLPFLAFGTVMADFDSDGQQELFIANGHIDDWRERTGDLWYMPAQLFVFDGRKFQDCAPTAGPYFDRVWLGRAVATADFDRDGDVDLVVVHQNDPVGLLRNDSDAGHWLCVHFLGTWSNRRGVGVQVTVQQGPERRLYQELAGGTSYCASHQPMLHFGLGASTEPCQVTIRWPSGRMQDLRDVPVDQRLFLREQDAEGP